MQLDAITISRIQLLHPQLRKEAGEIYAQICAALTGKVFCRFSCTLRTNAEQDALFAIGRTKPGNKVTQARGGESYHNYGLALDIVLVSKEGGAIWNAKTDFDGDQVADWMEVVNIFKRFGWEWGGDWKFKDMPHFQKTLGYSITQLKEKKKDGVYPLLQSF